MGPAGRPPFVVNVSSVPWKERGQGTFGYGAKGLGARAGSRAFGLTVYRIDPGHVDFPTHWHIAEEEVFFGLFGTPRLVQTDFHGKRLAEGVLAPGHCAAFPADRRLGHHLELASDAPSPAVVIAIGQRAPIDVGHYPGRDVWVIRHGNEDVRKARKGGLGMFRPEPVGYYHGLPDAFEGAPHRDGSAHETTLPATYGARESEEAAPVPIVDLASVPPRSFGKGAYERRCTQIGPAIGTRAFDINHDEIAPGHVDSPFHFHLGDEEMFYVLDGVGVLRVGGPGWNGPEAEVPIGEGDCISFPTATGIAHQIIVPETADGPLRMLTIADRAPVDVVRMVDSDKWNIKRPDADKELATAMGLGVLKGAVKTEWLDSEPLLQKTTV